MASQEESKGGGIGARGLVIGLINALLISLALRLVTLLLPDQFGAAAGEVLQSLPVVLFVWAATKLDEEGIANWLFWRHRAHWVPLLLLAGIVLVASLLVHPVHVTCLDGATLHVGGTQEVRCAAGESSMKPLFGLRSRVEVNDGAGRHAARSVLPFVHTKLTYPTDFRYTPHLLVVPDTPTMAQMGAGKAAAGYGIALIGCAEGAKATSACRSKRRIGLGKAGVVLGASEMSDALATAYDAAYQTASPVGKPHVTVKPNACYLVVGCRYWKPSKEWIACSTKRARAPQRRGPTRVDIASLTCQRRAAVAR